MKEKSDIRLYYGALTGKAFLSQESVGRRYFSQGLRSSCLHKIVDPFFLDKELIRASRAYQRLQNKTQVFVGLAKYGLSSNRRQHTDQVVSWSLKIATILGLNVFLTEAIALGHDIGHTPFGHLGERLITKISGHNFRHEVMSVVILQAIENDGRGLNLSWETLEGIIHHSRGASGLEVRGALPLEYSVVALADKLACIFSDLEDAVQYGYFRYSQLPGEFSELGHPSERESNLLLAIAKESAECGTLSFKNSEVAHAFESLRLWSYSNFYNRVDKIPSHKTAAGKLKAGLEFLFKVLELKRYNPFIAAALATDNEVSLLAQLRQDPSIREVKLLQRLECFKMMDKIPGDKRIDIFEADLNRADFQPIEI